VQLHLLPPRGFALGSTKGFPSYMGLDSPEFPAPPFREGNMNTCKECGRPIKDIKKYCNNKCQQIYQRKVYIKRWIAGEEHGIRGKTNTSAHIRNYLLEQADNKCSICGWGEVNYYSGNVPLDIDHIDGNHENNSPDNLRVLCPNCHSLTATYKRLNQNGTRTQR